VAVIVTPSAYQLYQIAGVISATGVPSSFTNSSDSSFSQISSSFSEVVVAAQGVRVRNVTQMNNLQGELAIGRGTLTESANSTWSVFRGNSATYAKMNSDPGVILQAAYIGNPDTTPAVSTAAVDYNFDSPGNGPDGSMTAIRIQDSVNASSGVQEYEIEIVTHYVGRVLESNTMLRPSYHEVNPNTVASLIQNAFARTPEFSITRNCVRDDGREPSLREDMDSVAKGAMAAWRIGKRAVKAWANPMSILRASKNHFDFLHRVLTFMGPDGYVPVQQWMEEYKTYDEAIAAAAAQIPVKHFDDEYIKQLRIALERGDYADLEQPLVIRDHPRLDSAPASSRRSTSSNR
jgi:hypothetical protein